VFLEFDTDGDGIITIEELAMIMQSLGKRYSRKKLQEIIASADEDGNGTLEFPEVVALMEKNMKKSRFLDEMRRAFHHFDHDDNGYISPEELRKALQRMGVKLGKLDFLRMLRKVDTDKDGQISFKEFVIMMLSDVDI
jgi:calcium-binding protein CML